MAAANPATPAPITTTSVDRSQLRCVAPWGLASCAAPTKATPAALVDRNARRLTWPEAARPRSVACFSIVPSRSVQRRGNRGLAAAFALTRLPGEGDTTLADAITMGSKPLILTLRVAGSRQHLTVSRPHSCESCHA